MRSACPACGLAFSTSRAGGLEAMRGRMVYGPERLVVNSKLDAAAFDTCPACGERFAAPQMRIFGEFVRARLRSMGMLYGAVIVVIAALAASVLLGRP